MYNVIIALTQYPEVAINKTNKITVNASLNLPKRQPTHPTSVTEDIDGKY